MARKEDVDELQGATNAIRGFLGVFRHAAQLESKLQAALRANALLTQWEHDAAALKAQVDDLAAQRDGLQRDVAGAQTALDDLNARITVSQKAHAEQMGAAKAELAAQKQALADELTATRQEHEAALAGLRETTAAAEAELEALRADAQRIRAHFSGAPA